MAKPDATFKLENGNCYTFNTEKYKWDRDYASEGKHAGSYINVGGKYCILR